MTEQDKKRLGYSPKIEYTDEYYSDYTSMRDNRGDTSSDSSPSSPWDDDFTNNIQNNFNTLQSLIPLMDQDLQTAVNQVFKPVFYEWYRELKNTRYPKDPPGPGDKIIRDPQDGDDPNPTPGELDDPTFPPENTWEPPEKEDPVDPKIYTYKYPPESNWGDPPTQDIPDSEEEEDDDNLFEPATPFIVEYADEVLVTDIIKLEYDKNILDLFNYYTRSLADIISQYSMNRFMAVKSCTTEDQLSFIANKIDIAHTDVADDLRHLSDTGVRNENNAFFKLNFYLNMFSLESTLYHMKSFKVAYEMRLRYASENPSNDGTTAGSASDIILNANRDIYDRKYDNAYINLYKYLNSSMQVLNDVLKTFSTGTKAKQTLIEKGGK